MKVATLIISLIAALAFTTPSLAATIQTSDTSQPWQTWADQSQVPTYAGVLPLTVVVADLACGGLDAAGCTSYTPQVDQTTGQILPGPPASISTEILGGDDARAALYHELGQVFWVEYMTPADEDQFMQIVGLNGTSADWDSWRFTRPVYGVTLTFPPFEWFAEGYRYCAEYGINQPRVNDEEGLGYPGSEAWFAAQQRQVCQLINRIGERNGIATPIQATYAPTHLTGRVIRVHIRTGHAHHNLTRGRIGQISSSSHPNQESS